MPVKLHNALSAAFVRNVSDPGQYTDGNGLTLRIEQTGNKHWVQRIRVDGKQRNIGIGGYPAVSLSSARAAALANLQDAKQGGNPVATKQAIKTAENQAKIIAPTFQDAANRVFELRSPSWTNETHAGQFLQSLNAYAFPYIGDKQVDEVTSRDVMDAVSAIWNEKPETARRVRNRIETVMGWAIALGYRTDNPAGKHVLNALPRAPRIKVHHKALPYADVPGALRTIRESECDSLPFITRLAFEYLVLNASRWAEVQKADWTEIDWESATWTISPNRMKARRPHRVPLSDRAIEILNQAWELTGGQGLIFPGPGGKLQHNKAFLFLLERNGFDATVHGFRSSFRDWVIEQTATPWAVGEAALAHTIGNATEQAYMRSDLFDKRRQLMQQWADYLAG